MKVTVLDETVPYPSEEEIQTEIEEEGMAGRNGSAGGKYDSGREACASVGEEIKNPFHEMKSSTEFEDIRFTVKDIKIQDTLPFGSVPKRKLCRI